MATASEVKPEKKCVICGVRLTEITAYPAAFKRRTRNGYIPYCVKCQQEYFDSLAQINIPIIAHFYCCVTFDVPFVPEELPRFDRDGAPWKAYLEKLRFLGLNHYEGEIVVGTGDKQKRETVTKYRGFFDGETDLAKLFGIVTDEPENIQARIEQGLPKPKKPTEKQVKKWGTDKTAAQCRELDRIYDNIGNAYKGNPDPRVEINLIKLAQLHFEQDRAIAAQDFDTAKRIQEIMKSTLETEGMKATDAKPVENLRIDSIAEYLEKQGAMKNRKIVGKSELIKILQKGKHKYRNSLDVVDEMMLAIANAVRKNDGLSELYEIPADLQITDEKNELMRAVTPTEKEVLAELGMVLSPKERDGGTSESPDDGDE